MQLMPSLFRHGVVDEKALLRRAEFHLVNKATGNIEGRSYTFRSSKPGSDSLTEKLTLQMVRV